MSLQYPLREKIGNKAKYEKYIITFEQTFKATLLYIIVNTVARNKLEK